MGYVFIIKKEAKIYLVKSIYFKYFSKIRNVNITAPEINTKLLFNNKIPCEYINLEHRTDRKILVLKELSKIDFLEINRFNAVLDKNGVLGCVKSHLSVLFSWDESVYPMIMVAEDDINFTIDSDNLKKIIHTFAEDANLHCLCLGYSTNSNKKYNEEFSLSNKIKTTSCYLVKNIMKYDLIDAFKLSQYLIENNINPTISALDIVWFTVQNKYNFAVTNTKFVNQTNSFSDIQKKVVNN